MNAERKENRKKMRIIMGESMGGAMALRLHRKKPDYWDGAILVAPMCKVGFVCLNLSIRVLMFKTIMSKNVLARLIFDNHSRYIILHSSNP